jgi:hypothetical protein
MGWTKFKISTALTTALLLIAIGAIPFLTSQGWLWSPRAVKSPDGRLVSLDAWNFKPTPVPYDLPYHPWVKRLDKLLPNGLKQRLHLSQPVYSSVAMPNFRGEPFLSAGFSIHNAPGAAEVHDLRLVVSDDHGQEFDPAVQDSNVQGQQGTQYWANEVQVFPRRGRDEFKRYSAICYRSGRVSAPYRVQPLAPPPRECVKGREMATENMLPFVDLRQARFNDRRSDQYLQDRAVTH